MPFKKGASGNPDGRKPKANDRIFSIGIAKATGVPDLPIETTPADRYTNVYKWEKFGNDNLFPQALALMFRRAVAHRSIIYHKSNFVIPRTLICQDQKVLDFMESVNNQDETGQEVFRKVYTDYLAGGNGYLEVVRYKGGINLFHKDFTKCRVKRIDKKDEYKIKGILVHPDWSKGLSQSNLIVDYPLYPAFKKIDGYERSIIHFKDYEPEFVYYGIPKFIAALDVCAIAWKTNKWNVSRLDNTFQSSGVLVLEGDYSQKDAEDIEKLIGETYAGEDNQGKLLTIVKTIGGNAVTFTPFNTTNDGDWDKLHDQANRDLVAAHVWQRSLCNMSDAAQLGNTTLIRNEYGLASRVIENDQDFFLKRIRKVITIELKLDASTLAFTNISPVPLTDIIKPAILWNENRNAFGYEDFTPEQETKYIEEQNSVKTKDNGTNNSSTSN